MRYRSYYRLIGAALLCLLAASPTSGQTRYEFSEVHMGMPVRIVMYAPNDSTARHAARAAFARIAYLDAMMSDYRPDSELNRLNASAGSGTWFKVSPELFEVLSLALEIAEASDGAFDPTVGPFVALWREARKSGRVPIEATLDSARRFVGWRMLLLDSVRTSVRLDKAGMRLDLGGIAKGYILQAACNTIRSLRVLATLVQAGGDLVAGAPPPNLSGWSIDVEGIGTDTDSAFTSRALGLANAALSSSGPTFQFSEINGVRYSHVLDARSGAALTSPAIAHVIDRHGALADGLATAFSVRQGDWWSLHKSADFIRSR